MLYLAHLKVFKSYYESDDTKSEQIHIVEADSESEVKTKVNKYYEGKDEPYYVSHYVEFLNINEVIV